MKMKQKFFVMVLMFVLGMMTLYGNRFETVVIDPTTPLKINTADYCVGVYRSINGGNSGTWAGPLNTGLTNPCILCMAIDPANPAKMMVGTFGDGIFVTPNAAGNWFPANTGLPASSIINALAIDPLDTDIIYAAECSSGGVYRSVNGGMSWNLVSPQWCVQALAVDPCYQGIVYAGTSAGLFKSTNFGNNWTQELPGVFSVHAVAIDPQNPTTVFAGGKINIYGKVFRGTPGAGDTYNWEEVLSLEIFLGDNSYGHVSSLAINPLDSTRVYAGTTGDGVFKSINSGNSGTWFGASAGLSSDTVLDLAIDHTNPTKLFAGTASGLCKTTDGGLTWFPVL